MAEASAGEALLTLPGLDEASVGILAGLLAFVLRPGDVVALAGDLAAGKTTFARAVIRSLAAHEIDEIPSPTFTLVQSYATPRIKVVHADLYRLGDAVELIELGLDPPPTDAVLLVEWPDRAGDALGEDVLVIRLADAGDGATDNTGLRDVTLIGHGAWWPRAARLAAMFRLVTDWRPPRRSVEVRFMQGDASTRRYARLMVVCPPPGGEGSGAREAESVAVPPRAALSHEGKGEVHTAILMDAPRQPDGPPIRDGKPYSRIAHLAEDVVPFVAISGALRSAGLVAPAILAHDIPAGLLIVEDLGDRVFGTELSAGASQEELWRAAVETLVVLRSSPPPPAMPLPDGSHYVLPLYDREALAIETELLIDWYWPAAHGEAAPASARAEFTALWDMVFSRLDAMPRGWVLRDYHSPNLIRMPPSSGHGTGSPGVGIIDFQDALLGPHAYDLVSLLQDARLAVPAALESRLLDEYCDAVATRDPAFDRRSFLFAYAALGAQRNTKIAGIFARLARRDGKPQYLAHLPRIWGYLERDLGHPELAALEVWYDRHLPPAVRRRAIRA